jgi:hypothetical protein
LTRREDLRTKSFLSGSGQTALDPERARKMEDRQRITSLVLKAVALGMAVVSLVLGFLPDAANAATQITFLSIGLFALAVESLQTE